MTKKLWLAGLLGVALLASGCGQALRQAATQEDPVGMVGGGFRLMGEPGPFADVRPGRELAAKLGLSAEQKARMEAIALKYRDQLRPADFAARRAKLEALLLAPQLDQAALAGMIRQRAAEFEAKRPVRLALAGELRAVLTPDQRETLAGLIADGRPQQAARFDALRERMKAQATALLGLTPSQLDKVAAVHAKIDALRADPRHDQFRQAAAAFVRSGDATALVAVTTGISAAVPVDEIVALVASLDADQRRTVVRRAKVALAMRFPQAF